MKPRSFAEAILMVGFHAALENMKESMVRNDLAKKGKS